MPYTKDVLIGAPDQGGTTGAILHADVGTTLPTINNVFSANAAWRNNFSGNEYVSEEGLTLTPSFSTNNIKDWSGATVRKVLNEFDGKILWQMLSTNEEAMKIAFGEDYVNATAATREHGKLLEVALGAHLADEQSFIFLMKDGDAKMAVVVPNGQITEVGETNFRSNDAIKWPVTLSCYPDENGQSIYIWTDDGQVTSA